MGICNFFHGAGELMKTVSNVYSDGLKPATKESGKFLERIPRVINAALAPLDRWILHREYSIEETKRILALKLNKIDPEKIVPPEPYVAIPALQAISYCMDYEELRNLYANLLAKSMNEDTKDSVHPAYVEIIKQLSPLDARIIDIFKFFKSPNHCFPIGKLRYCKQNETPYLKLSLGDSGFDVYEHIIDPEISEIINATADLIAISIQNLVRLGLLDVDYSAHFTNDHLYDNIRKNPIIKEADIYFRDNYGNMPEYQGFDIQFVKGIAKVTPLGYSFSRICCIDL